MKVVLILILMCQISINYSQTNKSQIISTDGRMLNIGDTVVFGPKFENTPAYQQFGKYDGENGNVLPVETDMQNQKGVVSKITYFSSNKLTLINILNIEKNITIVTTELNAFRCGEINYPIDKFNSICDISVSQGDTLTFGNFSNNTYYQNIWLLATGDKYKKVDWKLNNTKCIVLSILKKDLNLYNETSIFVKSIEDAKYYKVQIERAISSFEIETVTYETHENIINSIRFEPYIAIPFITKENTKAYSDPKLEFIKYYNGKDYTKIQKDEFYAHEKLPFYYSLYDSISKFANSETLFYSFAEIDLGKYNFEKKCYEAKLSQNNQLNFLIYNFSFEFFMDIDVAKKLSCRKRNEGVGGGKYLCQFYFKIKKGVAPVKGFLGSSPGNIIIEVTDVDVFERAHTGFYLGKASVID